MFIIEFHPSEGGDDAAKFAEELANSVAKYSGMSLDSSSRVITLKSTKLDHAMISQLSSLTGNHRIKRVPDNEKRGRKHTSTVRITFLDTKTDNTVSSALNEADIREEFVRGSGPGGQHRNKTSTAVRLTHIPSGIMVFASEERSQKQNREVAWKRLDEKISNIENSQIKQALDHAKREQLNDYNYWTWFAYRNQVKRPDGKTAPYDRCIAGRLEKILN